MQGIHIRNALTLLFTLSVFLGSIWYLWTYFHWQEVLYKLSEVELLQFGLICLCIHFAYICVRTWRWQIIVQSVNPQVGFLDLYWTTAVFVSLAIITPGQLGETLKIEMLKRRGLLGRLHGLGGFAVERTIDGLVIGAMAIVSLGLGSGLSIYYEELGVAVLLAATIAVFVVFIFLRLNPDWRSSKWLPMILIGGGSPITWFKTSLLTILSWGLIGFAWQVSLSTVDIRLNLAETLWLLSVVTIGTIMSLIPGGLGFSEVLASEILSDMGVTAVMAQTGALMLRVYALFVILFGLIHLLPWLIYRLGSRIFQSDSPNES